ncbi:arf-GAP with dual PH domain-containing protein 1 isoform X1 [Apodemus sylvaticus]|uniref:arf-GAP with dual PH domain-containing protein 1 isoform X1 n=1 Tax=Apodemus sylvaticus TaxID=10129 RepID=UPI002243B823|nr:arf-GAP with dual PH domain-containing protein 1 isoform X1 [Apodemus sylvaticus]
MAGERRRALLELLTRPGNARCADCGAPDPDWASYTLGVFICLSCSGIHRNIPQVSKVKSVRLDAWDEAQVEFMTSHGNEAARATFESKVPPFYYRPTFSDCQLLREQWIRAKYERQEFILVEKQEPYSTGYREGLLWKRGRDNGQFLSRKFVLTEREGALKYFNKNDAKEPKAVMKIEHLNATFQPAKIGHPHGLQVTYLKDNSTRNIFIYHEDGKEIVDWFNALRAARFHYLQVAFPGASDADLVPKLSRNYLKEGYMEKTGPKQTEGFRKRWFTMDDRRLMYFKDPLPLLTHRMPLPEGKSSLAARKAVTRSWRASHHQPRVTTGPTASPLSPLTANSCSRVRRSRTRGSGLRPSRRWWTGPCCLRSTQWKPTSSINPKEESPEAPGFCTHVAGQDRRRWTVGEPRLRAHTLSLGVAQALPGGAQASPLDRQFFRTSIKLTWFWASPDPGPAKMLPATPSQSIHFPAAGSPASQLEQDTLLTLLT